MSGFDSDIEKTRINKGFFTTKINEEEHAFEQNRLPPKRRVGGSFSSPDSVGAPASQGRPLDDRTLLGTYCNYGMIWILIRVIPFFVFT